MGRRSEGWGQGSRGGGSGGGRRGGRARGSQPSARTGLTAEGGVGEEGRGSHRRAGSRLAAEGGVGGVAEEGGDTPPHSLRPRPRNPGTPGSERGRQRRAGARAGWGLRLRPGGGGGVAASVEPDAPHLRPGSGRARSPRRLRLSELRLSRAHFRVSGAILGAPLTSGHAAGRGIWWAGPEAGPWASGGPEAFLRGWDSVAHGFASHPRLFLLGTGT